LLATGEVTPPPGGDGLRRQRRSRGIEPGVMESGIPALSFLESNAPRQVPRECRAEVDIMAALKDYRLNGYPKNEEGENAALPYADYLEWLADYLYEADAQLSAEQEKMFSRFLGDEPSTAMVGIGMDAGLHDNLARCHPCYEYPPDFEKEFDVERAVPLDPYFSYEEYYDEEMKEEISKEEYIRDDYEWHIELQEEKMGLQKHWPGFTHGSDEIFSFLRSTDDTVCDGRTEPPDAGWRVLLAAVLNDVAGKDRRVDLLHRFFIGYFEYFNK